MPQTVQTQTRKDPRKTRPVIGAREINVHGKRPDRDYRLVFKSGHLGVAAYEDAGYVVEKYSKDGPRIQGVRGKDGDVIETRGHVLMSISLVDAQKFVDAQQAEADEMERSIKAQDAIKDAFRGVNMSGMKLYDAREDPEV